ncbi:hypothetical protein BGX26_010407 [Mortierella sp. AD094]|nr:hypothetical protein BGX26_010407 [Mortierella sp. AD094]
MDTCNIVEDSQFDSPRIPHRDQHSLVATNISEHGRSELSAWLQQKFPTSQNDEHLLFKDLHQKHNGLKRWAPARRTWKRSITDLTAQIAAIDATFNLTPPTHRASITDVRNNLQVSFTQIQSKMADNDAKLALFKETVLQELPRIFFQCRDWYISFALETSWPSLAVCSELGLDPMLSHEAIRSDKYMLLPTSLGEIEAFLQWFMRYLKTSESLKSDESEKADTSSLIDENIPDRRRQTFQIRTFSNGASQENHDYIKHVYNAMNNLHFSEEREMDEVQDRLKGFAEAWWKYCNANTDKKETWAEASANFKKLFEASIDDHHPSALQQLNNYQLGSNSMRIFGPKLISLLDQARIFHDKSRMYYFFSKVTPQLRNAVKIARIKTVEEAIILSAELEEGTLDQEVDLNRTGQLKETRSCYFCHSRGHTKRDCRKLAYQKATQINHNNHSHSHNQNCKRGNNRRNGDTKN